MRCFREGQLGISRYLRTKSTLPILINQDANSDVEDKLFDIQKRIVCFKYKAINWPFHWKMRQVALRDMRLENNACQDKQHSRAFPVFQDSTEWTKIIDFWSYIPTKVENFRLRPRRKQTQVCIFWEKWFWNSRCIKNMKTSRFQCKNGIDSFLTRHSPKSETISNSTFVERLKPLILEKKIWMWRFTDIQSILAF